MISINLDALKLPAYEGETVLCSEKCYNADKMFTTVFDEDSKSAKMLILSNTNMSEYNGYIEKLKCCGYKLWSYERYAIFEA